MIFFFKNLYYILGFGVHVKNMQDCCIGTHMAVLCAAFLTITSISGISPHAVFPQLPTPCSLPNFPPIDPSVWCSSPCVHVFSLFNTHLWVTKYGVCLFLCQFAENDGLQVHPCPYKGLELIVFDGCIVFHSVYVPHFPCPVYHCWAFGLVPGLYYLNSATMNIRVHVSL